MIFDKNNGNTIRIIATFTSTTGVLATPAGDKKISIYDNASATQIIDAADMTQFDSLTGRYYYDWDITNVAVGNYTALFKFTSTDDYGGQEFINIYNSATWTASAAADAVWDEQTSGHATAGSTGALLTTIASDIGLGTGSASESLHFENQNGTAKAGLQVWLTTDSAGAVLYTSKNNRTNSGGNITFYVDLTTTYYIWTSEGSTYVGTIYKTS